jgi:hypothetical protein
MTDLPHVSGDGETARVLGRLEAKVAAIEGRLERQDVTSSARMSAIEAKLDGMANTLAQSLGAAKLVHWLAGALVAGLGYLASVVLRQVK